MNASLLRALRQNCLEPLESRIAPATIFVGNPNVNDTEYADAPFVNTETSAETIATQVGPGVLGASDTFLMKLAQGDRVVLFAPGGNTDFITLDKGSAVAFFVDYNLDGELQASELTGMALGKGVSITVKGNINGDVVTNLKDDGTLDLSAPGGTGGLVSQDQDVVKFACSDVAGGLYVGGSISTVNGATIGRITAGDAADGETFDFFPGNPNDPAAVDVPGGNGKLVVTATAGEAGPSIQSVLIKSLVDRIEAGAGGLGGAKGGSVSNVEITSDADGFLIAAGNGGLGNGAQGSSNGGAGGGISGVYISGFADLDPNSFGGTRIMAGIGGDSEAASAAKGGAGGALKKIFVGYDRVGNGVDASTNLSQDSVLLSAGAGGDGKTAGKGGSVSSVQLRASVQDANGDEMSVIAGAGGDAFAGGKAGAGGSLSKVDVRNQNPLITGSLVSLRAGNGGTAPADGVGAAGGSIKNASVLGEGLFLNAGNGSSGTTGGKAGVLKSVNTIISETVISRELTLNAGIGGNGTGGKAGAGGTVTKLLVSTADFSTFTINAGTAGNGGTSVSSKGGAGGAVSKVTVLEVPLDTAVEGDVLIRAGAGGNGGTAGGAGGQLNKVVLSGFDLNIQASAGSGGSATSAGNGGKGGQLKTVQFSSFGTDAGTPVAGTLTAGTGGNGIGASGSGGVGGSIANSAINVDGDLTVAAGAGGSGAGGASGRGGSLSKTGAFSTFGSGKLQAGDAGLAGGRAGVGGSISKGSVLRASEKITLQAGDGHNGGAGGDIANVNFSSSAASLLPAPFGDIVVSAGDGSALGSSAGPGGSIKSVIGYVSSGGANTTTFSAGVGGGVTLAVPGATASAAGGSIQGLDILGGGGPGSVVTISGGDAGDATTAASGGKGGDVKAVSIVGVDPATIIRSIAAGDGGDAGRGGTGGSVSQIYALGVDIGDRSGVNYGYATMGGIFAGQGGAGGGTNGSVSDIRAEGIAAIVAGRGAVPAFAERVSRIIVGTSNAPVDLLKVEQGDFAPDAGDPNYGTVDGTAYVTNNLVGFYADPTRTDTNKFAFTDLDADTIFEEGEAPKDGLIMARELDLKTFNFTPEAYLITTRFVDYNNRIS
jgi:hypothetical protein